jgi:hypothetical protein
VATHNAWLLGQGGNVFKISFINNDGGGFAGEISVEPGITAGELFTSQLGNNADPGEYLIRLNKELCLCSKTLADGDRMTVTPTKLKGGGFADA